MTGPIPIAATNLAKQLAEACPRHGVDLAGAVMIDDRAPHAEAWFSWLDGGLHGDLEYLQRTREERADLRHRNPEVQSLLVFGQRYTDGWPDEVGESWLNGVARYARGQDYHEVFLKSVKAVLHELRGISPGLTAYPATDTGPYLERDWAEEAGLGFAGKNTCLIHESLGSGLFLAVAPSNLTITDLETTPRPLYQVAAGGRLPRLDTDRCGRCTRCLDACPTGAIIEPRLLDAGRCLSTWTIEWQGRAPADQRRQQGDHLFGCDVCQQVCPWNGKALRKVDERPGPRPEYHPLPDHGEIDWSELLTMDPDTFRRRFRRTPLWRAHPAGLRRNALVVAANTRRTDLLPIVRRLAQDDPDPEVREVAAWAVQELEAPA